MTIKINGKEWPIEFNGTVGLVYLAQRILGNDEPFDEHDQYHQLVLYYAAFHQTNKKANGLPDLQDFIASMTSQSYKELTEAFWARWRELEGITNENQNENGDEERKGED